MIPAGEGWALEALVPRFNATVQYHQIEIPHTTLIAVPLRARSALLAGLVRAMEAPGLAINAMWAATTGSGRAHFDYILADMLHEHGARLKIAASMRIEPVQVS
jgi:hypothetical protein